mmetsp:Transcript_10313/g.19004  ORF Transcript_10313/g.19004 Transcript_10313/m.19004 type:complete len:82 (+) Transcript_10313:106-351(+)
MYMPASKIPKQLCERCIALKNAPNRGNELCTVNTAVSVGVSKVAQGSQVTPAAAEKAHGCLHPVPLTLQSGASKTRPSLDA